MENLTYLMIVTRRLGLKRQFCLFCPSWVIQKPIWSMFIGWSLGMACQMG